MYVNDAVTRCTEVGGGLNQLLCTIGLVSKRPCPVAFYTESVVVGLLSPADESTRDETTLDSQSTGRESVYAYVYVGIDKRARSPSPKPNRSIHSLILSSLTAYITHQF